MTPDPWQHLRRLTPARIALGRAGGSLPTAEVLRFAADHALARDAVWAELDVGRLSDALEPVGLPVQVMASRAADRATYLQRPDLGRRLDPGCAANLGSLATPCGVDVPLIVGDGLSALAAQRQVPAVLAVLVPLLRASALSLGPIVVVRQARVAIQDEVGQLLRARAALMLLGERPGLGTPDSLGAYLVFDPKPGNTDADRNCVSNIRPEGLPPAAAARALHYLLTQALARRLSGVQLKDDRPLPGGEPPARLPGSAR